MWKRCFKIGLESDFEESDDLSIKDMVFLFNSIRNRR